MNDIVWTMVKEEGMIQKTRSFHFRKMFECNPARQVINFVHENGNCMVTESMDDDQKFASRINQQEKSANAVPAAQQIGSVLDTSAEKSPILPLDNNNGGGGGGGGAAVSGNFRKERQVSDMELMKERFAKLLLGEDMSGGGKGVSSALALSNAITNLAASAFGEQSKLEPMSTERKARWKKEVEWLLSVSDYIVEFVPSLQILEDGKRMEIMVTQQRKDLLLNIPALRKLDIMLIGVLDNFEGEQEFRYVSKDADESEKGVQMSDKWWLPTVKVPSNGLSEEARQFLQKQKEAVNQVLKAAMAINAQVLSDMVIPDSYIESLPKNGRSSLGESVYRNITVEIFDPLQFLSTMDLSSEHKILDLKNRIEASIVIWKRKMYHKDMKSSWGSAISLEKRELFEERAETILLLIKQKFPGLPQSSLEISKIQYNKDVGLSILESYSRVLESLANTVMSRIQDVLYADSLTQDDPTLETAVRNQATDSTPSSNTLLSFPSPEEEADKLSSTTGTPNAMTLSDFMGWNYETSHTEIKKNHSTGNLEFYGKEEEERKPSVINTRRLSYIDKIEMSCLRTPTARH